MPYTNAQNRLECLNEGLPRLVEHLKRKTKGGKENNGVVTYVIYKILKEVYGQGRWEAKANAFKVLASCRQEFEDKIMRPHEDDAIERNGDV
jgi:hypothetical protein